MRNVLSEKIMRNVIFKFNAQEKNVSKHFKKKILKTSKIVNFHMNNSKNFNILKFS